MTKSVVERYLGMNRLWINPNTKRIACPKE
jgi:hypothetical protein